MSKILFLHAFDDVCAIFVESFNASWLHFWSLQASPSNFREHIILVLSPEADKKRCLQCVQCQQIRERFEDKWILRAAADFGDLAAAGKTSILGRACKLGNVMLSSGSAPKWINRIQRLLDKRRYTTFCKYKVTATFQEDGTTKVPKGLLRILILSRSWQKRQQAICSESHKFYNGLKFQCWRAINMFEVSFGFVL